jgi:hypothetical protein
VTITEQHDALAATIATGFAQAKRGELIDGELAVELVRQRREKRLKTQDERAVSAHPSSN